MTPLLLYYLWDRQPGNRHEEQVDWWLQVLAVLLLLVLILPWSVAWLAEQAGHGRAVRLLAALGVVAAVVAAGWATAWWMTPLLWLGSTIVGYGIVMGLRFSDRRRDAMYRD